MPDIEVQALVAVGGRSQGLRSAPLGDRWGLTDAGIPLYPELRNCPAPSAPRILANFDDVQRHQLTNGDQIVQTFRPGSGRR